MASPFLREGPDLALERPGIARLLVNLPMGFSDRGGAHQPAGVEIGERRVALALLDAIAHPFGVDPGVDDQMRDMDALRAELAGGALRHRAQPEFGAGERGITDAAPRSGEHTSELQSRLHLVCRLLLEKKKINRTRQFIIENLFWTRILPWSTVAELSSYAPLPPSRFLIHCSHATSPI